MGKSHSLFEVVGLLRRDPKNRVIYIPDCGAWADLPGVAPYRIFITVQLYGLSLALSHSLSFSFFYDIFLFLAGSSYGLSERSRF